MNMLLDGSVDAYEGLPPVSGPPRLARNPAYRIQTQPSFDLVYLLFNQRAYGDRSRPHPILSDPEVRRALAMGIDRTPMLRSTYGAYARVADAPVTGAHWNHPLVPRGIAYDPSGARALLDRRGWVDHDGDGIRDKDGVPLSLRLNLFAGSATRATHGTAGSGAAPAARCPHRDRPARRPRHRRPAQQGRIRHRLFRGGHGPERQRPSCRAGAAPGAAAPTSASTAIPPSTAW
jgi:ABC-type transport system substrate-binding protein